MLSVKRQGHMMEQNNPPERSANNANCPEAKTPMIIPVIPRRLKIFRVVIGLSLAKKNPPTCMATHTLKSKISSPEYFPKFTKRITPKAM